MAHYMFPLLQARENETVFIKKLGGSRQIKNKCIDQGLVPGTKITVVSKTDNGPCILAVNNSKIMLSSGMTQKIYVNSEIA